MKCQETAAPPESRTWQDVSAFPHPPVSVMWGTCGPQLLPCPHALATTRIQECPEPWCTEGKHVTPSSGTRESHFSGEEQEIKWINKHEPQTSSVALEKLPTYPWASVPMSTREDQSISRSRTLCSDLCDHCQLIQAVREHKVTTHLFQGTLGLLCAGPHGPCHPMGLTEDTAHE